MHVKFNCITGNFHNFWGLVPSQKNVTGFPYETIIHFNKWNLLPFSVWFKCTCQFCLFKFCVPNQTFSNFCETKENSNKKHWLTEYWLLQFFSQWITGLESELNPSPSPPTPTHKSYINPLIYSFYSEVAIYKNENHQLESILTFLKNLSIIGSPRIIRKYQQFWSKLNCSTNYFIRS